MTGRDIEKYEFVGSFLVVSGGDLNRIARIAQVEKVDTFHHAPRMNVEARDYSFGEHGFHYNRGDSSANAQWPQTRPRVVYRPCGV